MSILLECTKCKKRFRTANNKSSADCPACSGKLIAAGRQETRTKTSQKQTVSAAAPKKARRPLSVTEVDKAISEPIKRVRTPVTYSLALLIATAMTLLVPVVYLTLVGAVGYATYYHAVNDASMIMAVRNARGRVFAAIAYVGVIFAGVALIAFMLKPFFTRQRHEYATRSLNRKNEPALFLLIDKVCDAVGARRPVRVDLDCQVNASASFDSGLWAFLAGNLVLTIGAPLAAGLSARELAGVLAHEFGHFSQGVGMRLTRILISMNMWLDRVVHERDSWDEQLASSAAEADLRLGWILYLAQGGVWVSRKTLWLLLVISRAVSGYALRQMEYDADTYESRLVGAEVFTTTSVKLPRLSAGLQMSFRQADEALAEDKLIDDLPRMTVSNAKRLPASLESAISADITDGKTHWFDSHPATRDRIAAAKKRADAGVFVLDAPAAALFSDFDAQCKATTKEFYRQVLGRMVSDDELISAGAVEAKEHARDAAFDSLLRYTGGLWRPRLRLGLIADSTQPAEVPKESAAAIRRLRNVLASNGEKLRDAVRKWDLSADEMETARAYESLHRAEVKMKARDLDPAYQDEDKCKETIARLEHRQRNARQEVEQGLELTRDRFTQALQLLNHPKVEAQIKEGDRLAKRSQELVTAFIAIEGQLDTINEIRVRSTPVSALVSAAQQPNNVTDALLGRLGTLCDYAHAKMTQVRDVLANTADPLVDRGGETSLGSRLVPAVPHKEELGQMAGAVQECLSRVQAAQVETLAGLAEIAERVETALKLPLLPDPRESTEAA